MRILKNMLIAGLLAASGTTAVHADDFGRHGRPVEGACAPSPTVVQVWIPGGYVCEERVVTVPGRWECFEREVCSPGRYETTYEMVRVPGFWKSESRQVWVPGYWVEDSGYDNASIGLGGKKFKVKVTVPIGSCGRRWIPGHFENQCEQVWVPERCEQRPVQRWVPGTSQRVQDRRWIEPTTRVERVQVWKPGRYEIRAVGHDSNGRGERRNHGRRN